MESDPNIDATERAVLSVLSTQIQQPFKQYSSLKPTLPSVIVENGHITELYLIRLTQSSELLPLKNFPEDLAKLQMLNHLALVGQEFEVIPDCIGEFTNLMSLDLSWNPIREISKNIMRIGRLKELNISYNRMAALPPWLQEFVHENNITVINKKPQATRLGDEPNEDSDDPWRDFANYPY